MRIVVIGATGNVGLAVLRALTRDDSVDRVVGVARRLPSGVLPHVRWVAADIVHDDLTSVLRDADAVIDLAWAIQPARVPRRMRSVNIDGTARLLDAVVAAGVPALVYASSVGAYSPRRNAEPVDESWPTHGVATSTYGRHKAYVERMLDAFEARHPDVRVVRLRPGLIFQEEAAASQHRYFAGPLLPRTLLRPGGLPVLPHLYGVRFQAVHADDVAAAYRRAVLSDARGAFNVAADPVLTTADVADLLEARPLPIPLALARVGVDLTWRLRLHPLEPGWLDLAAQLPVMDTHRARDELGWAPDVSGRDALRAVLHGIAAGRTGPTPPLRGQTVRQAALDAVRTGMGARMGSDPRAREPARGRVSDAPGADHADTDPGSEGTPS